MKYFLLLLSCMLFSQNKFQVKYTMVTMFDGPKTHDARLLFADSFSCFEYKLSPKDTAQTEKSENGNLKFSIPNKKIYTIYTNFKKRLLHETNYLNKIGKVIIQDTLVLPKWNLTQESAMVNNIPCFKATTIYKGRNYEVWYSLEYPTSFGPWKLHGLPGLIIKAEDSKKEVYFEAKEIGSTTETIENVPSDLKVYTPIEYKTEFNKYLEGLQEMLNSKADRNSTIDLKFQKNKGIELE